MDIKLLKEDDYLDSLRLSEYAFQYNVPEDKIPARLENLKSHKLLGIRNGSSLAAKLHIIPLAVSMNGAVWRMGGIAGVAAYPEYRRSGYVKSLIIAALSQMQEDGQIVSLLAPFDFVFYRKFGWEILSDRKKVIIEKMNLKFLSPQPGIIRRYSKAAHQSEIEDIYQKYCENYTGLLFRDTKWWKEHVYDDNSQMAVYYNTLKEAIGYILYNIKDRKMDIQEMAALNQEAREGLWNFICQHDSMVENVTVTTSVHDPFPYYLNQPKLKTEIMPYFMCRIVNVKECLERFSFNRGSEPIFLHIEDHFALWNNGTYLVGNDEVKEYKAKQGSQCVNPPKRGIRLSINELSTILFGYKRPCELYNMGLIKGSKQDVDQFETMIPQMKSAFYDFF
ncbi:GNAT family N-acetyltransferase [Neobacillus cucumis]|uniref:GNAT family N-acetyltransferase n=1 Tax=Neobacillus cucumis TaxID=1740721 RepID=A0A2N5HLN9_9BACI|nr:GNAT family N-acetyltransferase [Neobacillus cucumis]PLS06425.1 GNAT family N-acetyltransferase [Neobacillus cucumis]